MKLTDEAKLGGLTFFCLILTAFLFQYIIAKPINLLAALSPFYFFLIYLLVKSQSKSAGGSTMPWNIMISLVTVLVIIIFAIR
jgi:hypothetical protein